MSLIPFHPQEGREIVLRHRNAIVVRDPSSQRLEIRSLTECPTCHRPLRSASPERSPYDTDAINGADGLGGGSGSGGSSGNGSGSGIGIGLGGSGGAGGSGGGLHRHEGYVDPNYFRMLRAASGGYYRIEHSSDSGSGSGVGGGTAGNSSSSSSGGVVPASPLRRIFQSIGSSSGGVISHHRGTPPDTDGRIIDEVDDNDHGTAFADAGFVPHAPSPPPPDHSSPIRKEAFSPNYFGTFFVEERELGRGGKGVVLLVRHEIDGCILGHFACKRVPVGDDHAWLEKVLVEVELLATLSHPNLVSYRHVWLENVTLNRFGPSVACAFILQQYCNGGDLQHYINGDQPREATKEELKARMRRRSKGQADHRRPSDLSSATGPASSAAAGGGGGPVSGVSGAATAAAATMGTPRQLQFDEIYSLFKDITSGLAYLHAANYVHRDLKPSNCLLHRETGGSGGGGRSSLTCLISDFGEVQPENVMRRSTGSTGTISYCAPEVLRQGPDGLYGNFTAKSDVFSLGMILYFMCFGHLPYRSANTINEELEDVQQLRAEITQWKGFQYERRERPDLPSKLYQLLTRLLSINPADRPTANEVLQAIRPDSGLDAFARQPSVASVSAANIGGAGGAGSGPSAIAGRRIQNLDSPHPPTSPVRSGDPVKLSRERGRNAFALDLSDDSEGSDFGRLELASEDEHTPGDEAEDSHNRNNHISNSSSRSSSSSSSNSNNNSNSNSNRPPLLMPPPPTTFLGKLQHNAIVAQHRAALFVNRNAATVAFLVKVSLFLVKMASLAKPCWPFTVRWGLGSSLVAVAALDLGISSGSSVLFAAASGNGVGGAGSAGSVGGKNSRTAPSVRGHRRHHRRHRFDRHSGDVNGAVNGEDDQIWQQQQQHHHHHHHAFQPSPSALLWTWDWRISALLFCLHVAVLWVASRSEVLCAGSHHGTWERW